MASLLGWGKKLVQHVAHDVNNDVVHPIQRAAGAVQHAAAPAVRQVQGAVAQINPADNGRTHQTVMQRGAQYAPQAPQPVVQQIQRPILQLPHVVVPALKAVSTPFTAPVKADINAAKMIAGHVTGNIQATQNANQAFKQNLNTSLDTGRQFVTRPVAEVASSVSHPFTQHTFQPTGKLQQTVFGKTPVQNIQKKVKNNYDTHPNLPIPARLALAAGEGAASVANDAPVIGSAAKGIKLAAPAIKDASKAAKVISEARVPLNQVGAVGKNVPKAIKSGVASEAPKQLTDSQPLGKISPKLSKAQPDTLSVPTNLSGGKLPSPSVNNTTKQVKGLTASIKQSHEFSPALKQAITSTPNHSSLAEKALAADAKLSDLPKATKNVLDTLAKPTHQLTDQNAADAIAVMKAHDAAGNVEAAQQIHDLLATHGETSGQFINSFKLISNRTPEGILYGARRALKGAGVDITPEMEKSIKGHIDNIKATQANTPERELAVHNLIQHVHSFVPSSAGDKIVNFWRAGLLTSPITTGGNIIGNTGEALTRNIWTNPVAAAADKAQSLFTGKRTKTLAGGQFKGAKQGVKDSAQYLKTGFDPNNPLSKFEQKSDVNYGQGKTGKAVGAYVNTVYRGLGAQDKPFRQAAANQAAGDLARADAINLGLKGRARAAYIREARANPDWNPQTFNTDKTALKAGAYSVFGNETALGHAASALKNPKTYGGHTLPTSIAQFVLPFSQVPASIAVRIMERSNLGSGEIIRQIMNVKKGLPYDQRAVSEAIGNGTFGPAIIAAGYALSKSDGITGNYPTDPKEQEIWKAQRKQPNAVRVGNRWYSLNYIQPFGALLGIGAQAHKDKVAGKSPTEIISSAGATAAKSVESQSFLQGINGLLTAVNDPQRGAGKYVDQVAGSIVPNFIKTGAKAADPMQRDTKGIIPSIKGGIPGVRQSLPAKQDMFGRNMKRADNPLNTAFNPLRPSKVIKDPVVDELARLQNAGQGIIPTQFNNGTFGKGKLTDQQVRDLQSLVGAKTYQAYTDTINDPRYASLSDEQKKAALAKAGAGESDAFKRQFAAENNIPLNKQASKNAQKILNGGKVDPFSKSRSKNSSTTPKVPKASNTVYDPNTNSWTQTSATGKVTKIASDGSRTVVTPGLGKIKNARPDYVSTIRSLAAKYNVDPNAALAVASVEGLGGGVGDGGHAFGPFQLNDAGGVITGKFSSPQQAQAWAESPAGIEYALQQISQVAGGKKGQDAINAIVNGFERPLDPNSEVANASAIYSGRGATLSPGTTRVATLSGGTTRRRSTGGRTSAPKTAANTKPSRLTELLHLSAAIKPPRTVHLSQPKAYKDASLKQYSTKTSTVRKGKVAKKK